VAATSDNSVIEKVKSKMTEYLGKVEDDPTATSLYKGLPKKYHAWLNQIIHFIEENRGLLPK